MMLYEIKNEPNNHILGLTYTIYLIINFKYLKYWLHFPAQPYESTCERMGCYLF